MIQDLVTRVAGAAGLDNAVAEKAVGIILGFLKKEGPAADVGAMLDKMPGAADLIAQHDSGGGLMGSMPGVMGLGSKLMGAGIGMGEIGTIGRELFAYGRETAGEETMGRIVSGIPGLSQFV